VQAEKRGKIAAMVTVEDLLFSEKGMGNHFI
jgi:phosphotransferase system IIA component